MLGWGSGPILEALPTPLGSTATGDRGLPSIENVTVPPVGGLPAAVLTVARLRGHTPETAKDPPPLRLPSARARRARGSRSAPDS